MKYILLLTLLVSTHLFAGTDFLCIVKNDNNSEIYTLFTETNEKGNLEYLVEKRYGTTSDYEAGTPNRTRKFNEADLAKGVVMYSQQGFDIIRLQADSLSPTQGGFARMYYKKNVLTQRSWKTKYSEKLQVINDNGTWYAADKNGARMNHAFFYTGRFGVSRIKFSYLPEFDL